MAQYDVELVMRFYSGDPSVTEFDYLTAIEDRAFHERLASALEPDAEIRFLTPGGGLIGDLGGPWRGPSGYIQGWREWLKPFESFVTTLDAIHDVGDGKVLLLVRARARLREEASPSWTSRRRGSTRSKRTALWRSTTTSTRTRLAAR